MLYFASCPSQAYKADSMYIDLTCDNKFKQKKEAMISTGPIIYALALHQIWPNCQSWRNKHPTACILTFIPELEGTKTNPPPQTYACYFKHSCYDWQAGKLLCFTDILEIPVTAMNRLFYLGWTSLSYHAHNRRLNHKCVSQPVMICLRRYKHTINKGVSLNNKSWPKVFLE